MVPLRGLASPILRQYYATIIGTKRLLSRLNQSSINCELGSTAEASGIFVWGEQKAFHRTQDSRSEWLMYVLVRAVP